MPEGRVSQVVGERRRLDRVRVELDAEIGVVIHYALRESVSDLRDLQRVCEATVNGLSGACWRDLRDSGQALECRAIEHPVAVALSVGSCA